MELRTQAQLALLIVLYVFAQFTYATISYPSIQPIVGFSTACTFAYDTPVNNCDSNDLSGLGGTGSCSTDCIAGLEASQAFVLRLCAGERADGGSLIGQLFAGTIVNFVCGANNAASTTAAATTSAQATSAQSTTSMATDTAAPNTSTSLSSTASTSAASASNSEFSSTSTSTSSTTSTETTKASSTTSTSLQTSIQSATSSTSSSATSTSSSARSTSTAHNSDGESGGGSPFDNTFTAAASAKTLSLSTVALVCAAVLVWAG